MTDIMKMNREQLIEFAIDFNIFKFYDFSEYLETKATIIQRMNELNISMDEVSPSKKRENDTVILSSVINTNRN